MSAWIVYVGFGAFPLSLTMFAFEDSTFFGWLCVLFVVISWIFVGLTIGPLGGDMQ